MPLFGFGKKDTKKEKREQKVASKPRPGREREGAPSDSAKDKEGGQKTYKTSKKGGASRTSLNDRVFKILKGPRITEKATDLMEDNIYTFEVDARATKNEIRQAVKEFYNVEPIEVRTVSIPSKKVFSRRQGMEGRKSGGKKAYVQLKDGDSIAVM